MIGFIVAALDSGIDVSLAERHIRVLASREMEGRMTLSRGMVRSSQYIASAMERSGLRPGGKDGFFDPFTVTVGQRPGELNTARFWNGEASFPLQLGRDYMPVYGSKTQTLLTAPVVWLGAGENVAGKWVAIPRSASEDLLRLKGQGAVGFILVGPQNPGGLELPIPTRTQGVPASLGVPVIAVTAAAWNRMAPLQNGLMLRACTDLQPNEGTARNVIGVLPGHDRKLRQEFIIIGAHYDHLGYGETGSRSGHALPHFGADDNASGTAGMLALADAFAKARSNRRTIIFQAYSGEELGLLGSRAWVAANADTLAKTDFMVNMDMIGRLRAAEGLTVFSADTALPFAQVLASLRIPGLDVKPVFSTPGNSDHASFVAAKVPALFFNTGLHAEYHTEADTSGTINFKGVGLVLKCVKQVIEQLDAMDARLEFTGKPVQGGGDPGTTRRVRVGFIPDMGAEDPRGLRLTGATPGSPAELAGLKPGDILVSFDGKPIRDINDLQEALVAATAGFTVKIRVIRGADTIELDITPTAPQS